MIRTTCLPAIILVASTALAQLPPDVKSERGPDVPPMRVRPGYRVTRALPDKQLKDEARFLEFADDGKTLFVSFREPGYILALRDPDENGVFKTSTSFVKDRRSVQGMDFHNGWLYFSQASEGSVSRARDTNGDGVADDVAYAARPGRSPRAAGTRSKGCSSPTRPSTSPAPTRRT